MTLPLAGIRVLDLSRVLAGPWATQMLADLGADVIKIERPGSGDDTRGWGPPYLGDSTTESAYFLSCNRGKKSVAVDIASADGQRLLRELAAISDVVVENFKLGGLVPYGLDYASLAKINPKLVYCSITGFGQDGPYAHRPGYDFAIQGMGGLMSITGEAGGEPQKVGVAVTDIMTGMYATIAVLGALRARDANGVGQQIDLALLDVQVAYLANQASSYLVSGKVPSRLGNAHPSIVPYQAFQTADGWIVLAVGNDEQFRRWAELAGAAELAADERFRTNAGRTRNRDALVPRVAELMHAQPSAWWIERCEAAGVPYGPINDIAQVFADPQVIHRGMKLDLPHPTAGTAPGVRNPIRYGATPITHDAAPPTLGQHTDGVLADLLGLDADAIAKLRATKAIG
ncbi:CaiB/BaiF CoA transferase family protein [Roseiterribacter gracilis]|uniref:CoA transferase n=1 Tax=Roseiterribacter gracilis TaxID=2812848 RepID=A0A8S8XG51_9PROT|nr:CoA transferase [Rhodospirillales bacterium TMPK1]